MTRFHIEYLPTWPGECWYQDRRVRGQWCVLDETQWAEDPIGSEYRPVEWAVVFTAETFDAVVDWIRAQPDG